MIEVFGRYKLLPSQSCGPDQNKTLSYVALLCAGLGGVLGTLAFSLMPKTSPVLDWAILTAAMLGIGLGIPARRTRLGQGAIVVGNINVAVWLFIMIASNFYQRTPFYIGQTSFPKGDSIEITSVHRTREQMVVKGHYNLVSADRAQLALYITSSSNPFGPTDTKQWMRISKGKGDFELIHPHLVPGLPHVTMYTMDATGKPFAGVYFGNKEQALEEGKLDLGDYQSSNGIVAAAQTLRSNTRDISSQTSPFRDTAKYLSPFTRVHFDTNDINKVVVAYKGSEYELEAIDDLSVADILDFCRRQYGQPPFGEGWAQKRFAEDLVIVLSDMKHPVSSDNTVRLTLVDPQTGQQKIIAHASMTGENRAAIFQDRTLDNSNLLHGNAYQDTPFYIGKTYFRNGDSIAITSVRRTKEQMVVKGHYNLAGADRARLGLHITTSSTNSTPTDSRQWMQISKGQGDFELTHPHVVPGWPHVAMYPIGGGESFADIYFGTQDETAEDGKSSLGN